MWKGFIDSHLHLHDCRLSGHLEQVIAAAESARVCRFFCNATKEEDWPKIITLSRMYASVMPFFAIHPWYADSVRSGWDTRLHDILSEYRHNAGVGETGLDKSSTVDPARQMVLFEAHLEIAMELCLPVTIHCVKCWGKLIAVLEKYAARRTLPPVMVHSFNGSFETMERLVGLGCFISYSSRIADPKQIRLRSVFLKTPINSLLLETDAPDQINPLLTDPETLVTTFNEPVVIAKLYRLAAIQRNLPVEEFAEQIWYNATIFTNKAIHR